MAIRVPANAMQLGRVAVCVHNPKVGLGWGSLNDAALVSRLGITATDPTRPGNVGGRTHGGYGIKVDFLPKVSTHVAFGAAGAGYVENWHKTHPLLPVSQAGSHGGCLTVATGFTAAQMADVVWIAVAAPLDVWESKFNNFVTVIAT